VKTRSLKCITVAPRTLLSEGKVSLCLTLRDDKWEEPKTNIQAVVYWYSPGFNPRQRHHNVPLHNFIGSSGSSGSIETRLQAGRPEFGLGMEPE
jgi:hypothetical protein